MESQNLDDLNFGNVMQNGSNDDFESILNDSDIFSDDSIDTLIDNEAEISVLEGEKLPEEEIDSIIDENKKEDEVVFNDEVIEKPEKSASGTDEMAIVEDTETEKIVEEKIRQETEQYNNISDEQEGATLQESGPGETSFFEEDEDESVSLSQDELSNILEDVDASTEELSAAPETEPAGIEEVTESSKDSGEAVLESLEESSEDMGTLADEQIGGITEDVPEGVEDLTPESLGEPVTESTEAEESAAILGDAEGEPLGEISGEEIDVLGAESAEAEEPAATLEETAGEPLGEISGEEIDVLGAESAETEEVLQGEGVSEETVSAEDISSSDVSFFEEDEDESISLSGDELDNILQNSEVVEESASTETEEKAAEEGNREVEPTSAPIEEAETLESVGEETYGESIDFSFDEEQGEEMGKAGVSGLEELKEEVEPSITEQDETDAAVSVAKISEPEAKISASEKKVSDEDIKIIIKYLDSLLDKLPDDVIKEFAESEYYDLYNKILSKLGI